MTNTYTVSVYKCADCGHSGRFDEFEYEEIDGKWFCDCGGVAEYQTARAAEWVSVAAYETWRDYGGPEEGGWYYDSGSRIDKTLRSYLDHDEASAYRDALKEIYKGSRFVVHTTSEKLCAKSFPDHRPRYC